MFRLLQLISEVACTVAVFALAAPPLLGQIQWDVGLDWSETQNPNGPWSLNDGASPIANHWGNWAGSGNPGWSLAPSGPGHIPMWLRVAPNGFTGDVAPGTVVVHSQDTISGTGSALTNLTWTSPIAGAVDIECEVWFPLPNDAAHASRSNLWTLSLNSSFLASGQVGNNVSSCAPQSYTGTHLVAPGDVLRFDVQKMRAFGTFSALRLSIRQQCPAITTIGIGCTGSALLHPCLHVDGCAASNQKMALAVTQAAPGQGVFLAIGTQQASISLGTGCTLFLLPILTVLGPFAANAGGAVGFEVVVPALPMLTPLVAQGFIVDAAAPLGFSATNGIHIVLQP